MRTTLSAEATAFFTKHGHIELEIPHPLPTQRSGRDLWRENKDLQNFLVRKLGPIALALTGKSKLHLACDQWLTAAELPKKAAPIKELFSIQGFAIGAILTENPLLPTRRSPLGILPTPSTASQILFFRPNLILDWPHVKSDLYLVLYALPDAVYIHNSKDPFANSLKQYGYHFGDVLKNEFHPIIR